MGIALWTCDAVILLIEREGVFACRCAAGEISLALGICAAEAHAPRQRAAADGGTEGLDETYPEIKQRTKEEDGEIHQGDETAVGNADVRGRDDAPKGQTTVPMSPAARSRSY
jgi:hypothetical protein